MIRKSLLALCLFSSVSAAHPGRTASDGCHYCRTNCDSWGVPWNARHCHSKYTSPKEETNQRNMGKAYQGQERSAVELFREDITVINEMGNEGAVLPAKNTYLKGFEYD